MNRCLDYKPFKKSMNSIPNKPVQVNTVSPIPYLKTMIDGLTVENDPIKRLKLKKNAYEALLELADMEHELLTLKIV